MTALGRTLETDRLLIRDFAASDITNEYLKALNDHEYMRFSQQRLRRHNRSSCMEYLRGFERTPSFFLAICDRNSSRLVGTISVHVDPESSVADMGLFVFPGAAGIGYGSEAWRCVLDTLLDDYPMTQVTAGTATGNEAMRRIIKGSGMRRVAIDCGCGTSGHELAGCHVYYSSGVRRQSGAVAFDAIQRGPAHVGRLGRCGIVAHDAGGAHHIAAWISDLENVVGIVAQGPAAQVFGATGRQMMSQVSDLVAASDWLLVGTGWQTDLERNAIREGRVAGLPVVAVLDHWVNYAERFGSGDLDLPTALVVTDGFAEALAAEVFPRLPVARWPNRVADEVVRRTEILRQGSVPKTGAARRTTRVLLFGEPLGGVSDSEIGQPEGNALERMPEILQALGLSPESTEVRLRRHPSENTGKYDRTARRWPVRHAEVVDAVNRPLPVDLAWAEIVVGFTSNAMYLASLCDLRCYSLATAAGVPQLLPAGTAVELELPD